MVVRKIINIDEEKCTGCGQCVVACAEGALEIIDGKAKVIKDSFCDGLGACIGECPESALEIIERNVDEFDEKAVEKHLEIKKLKEMTEKCSCPSATPMTLKREGQEHILKEDREQKSKLGQWPIQLMLVPESAPFLKGKDLIVLADCAAVAYGNLHRKFIDGNAIVMGCPKFDDLEIYERKLKGIINNSGIKSISVVNMEVPCCFSLYRLVAKVMAETGSKIPFKQYVIGIEGDILT
ncbi:MAG: 4Fe-4S binding protein [Thermoplasmata archaeon]|nr:4Fe-4S binding protein [Thermoplasmata archaeon]